MADVVQPCCPRCGYDLAGVAASWSDRCELDGKCSECGLEFAWRDILDPRRCYLPWFFEHAQEDRVRSWWRTLRLARRPRAFFEVIRMERPLRPLRLLIFFFGVLLLLHVATCVLSAGGAYTLAVFSTPAGRSAPTPWQLSRGERSLVFSLLIMPYAPKDIAVFNGIVFTRYVFGFVALWPMLTAPAFLLLAQTFSRCRIRRAHVLRGLAYSMSWLPLPCAITIAGTLIYTLRWFLSWPPPPRGSIDFCVHGALLLQCAAIAFQTVWLARFWHVFCTQYLRLPTTRGVVPAMLTLGALAALVVLLLISRGGLTREVATWMNDNL